MYFQYFKLDFLRKVVVGGCQGVSRRLLLSVFFFSLEDCYVVARVAKKIQPQVYVILCL